MSILIFLFTISQSLKAEGTYYQSVSQLATYTKVIYNPYKDCDRSNKKYLCDEYLTGDKINENDIVFDCKLQGGDCTDAEQVVFNEAGLKYRHVGYYHLSQDPECTAKDPNDSSKSIVENASTIIKAGIASGEKFSTIYENALFYLNIQQGNVFRGHCLSFKKGWVLSDFLSRKNKSDILGVISSEVKCDLCQSEIKRVNDDSLTKNWLLAQSLVNRGKSDLTTRNKDYGLKFSLCRNGEIKIKGDKGKDKAITFPSTGLQVELPSITLNLQRVNGTCKIDFSKNCGNDQYDYLQKVEQITNTIVTVSPENGVSNKFCMNTKDEFSARCGDQEAKKFDKTLSFVKTYLGGDRAGYNLQPGIMMCIYAQETTTFNTSAVNFMVCQQKSQGLRHPGVENPSLPILDGKVSSANGLGGVTLRDACYGIKTFRMKVEEKVFKKYYDNVNAAAVLKADCEMPAGKKVVEEFFRAAAEDREKQVMLSIDVFRYKMDVVKGNLDGAIYSYGDQNVSNYVSFVKSCAATCYQGKPSDGPEGCTSRVKSQYVPKPKVGEPTND